MATLDEIAKSFANNPVFKALDGLPLAAYSVPPGIANMSNAFDAISKLAAPSKDIANMMKYNSIGSNIVNAGLIGSGIGAIANSFHKEHAKFFDAMKMVSESNKLFSQTLAAAVGRPSSELHELMQFASKGINASALGSLASLPAVKFEPRPTQIDWESLRSTKRPERAPYHLNRTLASEPSLLPPDVEQSFIYFGTLIARLRALPAPDIIKTLDWLLNREKQADRSLFLERLAHYLADGKDFAPTCWQVVTLWLNSRRSSAPTPTWYQLSIATDATITPTHLSSVESLANTALPKTELNSPRRSARITNWAAVLCPPLNKSSLYSMLAGLGLLTPTGELTDLGRGAAPRIWAGVVAALREKNYILHDYSAIHKVLTAELGIKLGVRSLNPAQGLPTEAENIKRATLAELRQVLGS